MIASGITTRYLANQDDLAYSFSANFSNVTGRTEIGFTGLSGLNSHFTFESGRVFDFDNRYVWSYQQLNTINISGNIVNGLYNYFIDGNPVCFLGNRASDYYTGFYVAPERVTVDLDLNVYSDATNYLIESPASILTGANITGYIVNTETIQERAFLVFSGDLFNSNVLFSLDSLATGYKISGGQSGEFIISQNYPSSGDTWASKLGGYTIPISLWTDFGNQITGININVVASPVYNIEFFTMFTGASGSNLFAGYAYVYQALTQSTGALPYCVEVAPISGFSGDLIGYFDLSGEYSGNVTGFIQGTDYVYGNVTSVGLSPSGNYYGNTVSGEVNTFISELVDPTGLLIYNYSLPAYGLATGEAAPGTVIAATGFAEGVVSAYIERSGALTGIGSGLLTGYWNGYFNVRSGLVNITGFQWATGEFFIDYGNYPFSGFVSGENVTGFYSTIYKIGTGINITIQNGSGTWFIQGAVNYQGTTGELLVPITPIMTSNTLPSGIVSASSESFSGPAYNAFGASSFSSWIVTGGQTGYIQYDFGTANTSHICNQYSIIGPNLNNNYAPYSWTLSGSDDSITWNNLDTQNNQRFTINNQVKSYEFSNNTPYNILRLSIFSSTGTSIFSNSLSINKLNLGKRIPVSLFGSGFIPTMTSNTAPYGVASASRTDSNDPFEAFDNNSSTFARVFPGASGVPSGYSVRLNGAVEFPNDNANSIIRGITGNNTYNYWWGDFTNIFGQARSKYAVTDKSNNLQFINLGISDNVFAVALSGNTTYVGGAFLNFSGKNRIFALENNEFLNPFNLNTINQSVYTISPLSEDVYVGVGISNSTTDYVSGQKGLIKADKSGNLFDNKYSLYNMGSTGAVFDVLNSDGITYAVGNFLSAKWYYTGISSTGSSGRYITLTESENNTTLGFPKFVPQSNILCSTLDASGNYIIGGQFTSISGVGGWNRICSYTPELDLRDTLRFNFNNTIQCFARSGDTLFVGGDFTTVNGVTRNRLCSINLLANNGSGELISGFAPSVSSTVYSIDFDNSGNLFVGGSFTGIDVVSRPRYAILDSSGNLNPISYNFNSDVRAIKNVGSYVYVGGTFTTIDGNSKVRLAQLDKNGNVGSFTASPNSTVFCIETGINGDLYVAGSFSNISSTSRNSIARYDSNLNFTDFNCGLNTFVTVNALQVNSSGDIYIGTTSSNFNKNGVPFVYGAAFDYNGNIKNWGITPNGAINTLLLNNDKILVGGSWSNSVGILRQYGAAFDPSGNLLSWNPKSSSIINSISTGQSGLLLGGQFTYLGDTNRTGIGYIDYSGNYISEFNANVRGTVNNVRNITGNVYIGGTLNSVNGSGLGNFIQINSESGQVNDQTFYYLTGSAAPCNSFYNDDAGSGLYVVSTTGYGQSNYLQYDLGFQQKITGYQVLLGTNYPSGWNFAASNDGFHFDVLDIQPNSPSFTNNFEQYYPVTGGDYRYFRMNFNQNQSEIRSLQLFSTGSGVYSRIFNLNFTGYGDYTGYASGNFTGVIGGVTGFQSAFIYATGTLSGTINEGSGSFRWGNVAVSGEPSSFVYLNYLTGATPAINDIYFLDSTGSGLSIGDTLNITGTQFAYTATSSPPFFFNSPQNLVNIINSGSIGTYGISFLQGLLVTGYLDNNILRLTCTGLSGVAGNNIKVSRACDNPDAIYIPHRYFQSGESFYPTSTTWTGVPFTGLYTVTIENSGIYSTSDISGYFYDINATTGIIWENSFSGNFQAYTGYINTGLTAIPYNTGTNSFSGCSYIPAATGQDSSGINIVLQVRNPYNISGNLAFFRVIIDEDIYSGYLQG